MKIGIDIDGVLTDLEQWQLDYGSKFYYEKYNKEIANFKGYETTEIFNINDKRDDEFWEEFLWQYVTEEPARKFANEITKKLHEDGNEIYIITARFLTNRNDKLGEKMRNTVKNWLKENNIYYDKIIFSPEDKLGICIENKIDLMIEDKPENINKISTKMPVICFNANYNENCQGKNIIRCYSWYDIYAKIMSHWGRFYLGH